MTFPPKRVLTVCVLVLAVVAGKVLRTAPQAVPPAENRTAPESLAFGPIFPLLSDAGDRIVFSYQGAISRMPRTGGGVMALSTSESS